MEDEITVLDVLVALAEWWKVLVLVPITAGLIGFLAASAVPQSYTASLEIPIDYGASESSATAPIIKAAFSARGTTDVSLDGSEIALSATAPSVAEANDLMQRAVGRIVAAGNTYIADRLEERSQALEGALRDDAFLRAVAREAVLDAPDIDAMETFMALARNTRIDVSQDRWPPAFTASLCAGMAFAVLGIMALLARSLRDEAKTIEGARKMERLRAALRVRSRI